MDPIRVLDECIIAEFHFTEYVMLKLRNIFFKRSNFYVTNKGHHFPLFHHDSDRKQLAINWTPLL